MKFIWSITLYETAGGFRVTIMGNGQTVHGEGRTPQAAHRAAEAPLVVKPWVTANPYEADPMEEHAPKSANEFI